MNIREYYQASDGLKPSKKGITLVRDQWNLLKDSFFDIDEKIVSQNTSKTAEILMFTSF